MSGFTLSIIIPCYNEKNHIRQVVESVRQSPIKNKEIIIVDDCSTDGTREMIKKEIEPLVDKVIYHQANTGKGGAIRSGFAAATGDIVIVQDSDLEYDPAEYPKIVLPIANMECNVCYGSRFQNKHYQGYFCNIAANKFLTWLSNIFTHQHLTDMETCYKAFRRKVIQKIELQENRFGFEPEITAKITNLGIKIKEVPISYNPRSLEEGKKIGWKDGLRAIWCIWKYSRHNKHISMCEKRKDSMQSSDQFTSNHALNYWSDNSRLVNFRTYWICRAREKMYRLFDKRLKPQAHHSILDLGTTPDTKLAESNYFEQRYPYPQQLTIASIEDCQNVVEKYSLKEFVYNYSGKPLPFNDKQFDILYCSAVLEHTGTRQDQKLFLDECRRVAHKCFITTPNRYFPIEMHSFIPFLHWLPWPVFQKILKVLGKQFLADIHNLNLLSKADVQKLLGEQSRQHPDEIFYIRTLGWPSNIVIVMDDKQIQ